MPCSIERREIPSLSHRCAYQLYSLQELSVTRFLAVQVAQEALAQLAPQVLTCRCHMHPCAVV